MVGLISLAVFILLGVTALWVKGIDDMHKNHPDYKGEDLFGEEEISYSQLDEFTIEFEDWIRVCKLKQRPYDFEDIEKLLEIYKEEKDL